VSEEKHFGIVISKDLKVSKQCAQAYAKANNKIEPYCTKLQIFYYSYVSLLYVTPRKLYLSMEPTL